LPRAQLERVRKALAFLQDQGLLSIRAVGSSEITEWTDAHGREHVLTRTFVLRDPNAGRSPFWRVLLGGEPRHLETLPYIPEDTVFFNIGLMDATAVWELVRRVMDTYAEPFQRVVFESAVAGVGEAWGMSLPELIGSVGPESMISLSLDRSERITMEPGMGLPPMRSSARIPKPSAIVALTTRGPQVEALINGLVEMARLQVESQTLPTGTRISVVRLPDAPDWFEPCYTFVPGTSPDTGILLMATSRQGLMRALEAGRARNGVLTTAGFRHAFSGMPPENNGMLYISPRLFRVVKEVMEQAGHADDAALVNPLALAAVRRHEPSGMLVIQRDNISCREGIATWIAILAGLLNERGGLDAWLRDVF